MTTEFGLLGPLEVRRDGAPVLLAAQKQRALLAVLLLHAGEVVSTDRLIDALWGEKPPARAAKALQVYVSQLRKALDAEGALLVTRPPGYAIELPPTGLDLQRFEQLSDEGRQALARGDAGLAAQRLREALTLWRGAPLADLSFEPFAQPHVARLEEQRLAATEDRIDADLALGHHTALVGELEALVKEHPLRERLRGQLMLALYRSGRQAEALAAYQDARRTLVEELGIEPGKSLRELERAMLAQDDSLDVAPASTDEFTTTDDAGRSVFVGRAEELAALSAGLEAALAGHGGLFLVLGEPGIGKTRLAEEMTRRAQSRGAGVLVGRCWEAGGAPAYWPWVQSLRTYIEHADDGALRAQLGTGAADIAQILPELRKRFPDLAEASPEGEGARFRMFDSVARLLRSAAAARPLLLVLDDLHAADEPSLLLLRFVATALSDSPMLVLGTYRDVDPTIRDPLASTLAELAREPVTHRVELTGLAAGDVGRYIELSAGTTPTPQLVATISRETEGNPLFLGELVRLLAAEGRLDDAEGPVSTVGIPQTVREVIGRRLGRLSEQCVRALTLASILGREFAVDALEHVAEISSDQLLEVLDEATSARVLTSVPGAAARLRFAHVLIRETLYDGLSPLRRVHLHRRVGATLEAAYADDREPHLAELAHHYFAGQDFAKALEYSRGAGDRALGLLAYEEAARLYSEALEALDIVAPSDAEARCTLLVAVGEARSRAGDAEGAREAFLSAVRLATRYNLPRLVALAALGYGGRLVFARAGNDPRVVPLLEQSLEGLGNLDDSLRARLLARLAGALRDEPSPARRNALSAEGLALARRAGDGSTLAYALDGRASALLGPDTLDEQIAVTTELIAIAGQVGESERAAFGHAYRAHAYLDRADRSAADVDFAAMAALAAELRLPTILWLTAASAALNALLDGRFDDAEQAMESARARGVRSQALESLAAHSAHRYLLLRHQDRVSEVEDEVRRTAAAFPARPVCRCVLASALARAGKREEAREIVAELAAGDFAQMPLDMEYLVGMSLLAELCSDFGEQETCGSLYDLLLPWHDLTASDVPEGSLGSVARGLGLLAASLGRHDAAEEHFRAALEVNARLRTPVWLAYTRADFGRMLLERGRPGDATEGTALLHRAQEAARSLGIRVLERELAASVQRA